MSGETLVDKTAVMDLFGSADDVEVQENEEGSEDQEEGQEKPEDKKEEPKKEEVEATITEAREKELLAKNEAGTITEEEVQELTKAGYEIKGQEITDEYIEGLNERLAKGEELSENEINQLKEAGYDIQDIEEYQPGEIAETIYELYGEKPDSPEKERELTERAITEYRNLSDGLNRIMEESPEMKTVLTNMMQKGLDFQTAAAIYLDMPDLAPDPDDKEAYRAYIEERTKKKMELEAQKKREQQRVANLKESEKGIAEFFEKKQVPKSRQDALLKTMDDFVTAFNEGDLKKYLDVLYKGLFADEEVKTASEKAAIIERNRKYIIEKKKNIKPAITGSASTKSPEAIPDAIRGMFE